VIALTCCLAGLPGYVSAQDHSGASGIELPGGETVAALEWTAEGGLILLVIKDDGYALRGVEVQSGDVYVIPVPRDFGNIRHESGHDEELSIEIAPGGGSVAVLERTANPLYSNELSVYLITGQGLDAVDTYRIPDDFNPNEICYSADGQELYLAARPYVNPEQPYSIGRFSLQSRSFTGIVPKSNLDLIDELACVNGSLAVVCRSYRGEFPLRAIAVLTGGGGDAVLHAGADGFILVPLADGRLLFGDTGGPLGSEAWLLEPGEPRAAEAEFPEGLNASYQCTADGSWLGMLLDYDEGDGIGAEYELVLQNAAAKQTLETTERSSMFVFSRGGTAVCAVGDEGTRLYFYELPG